MALWLAPETVFSVKVTATLTYDFVTPGDSIEGHWITDVNPWIRWGNSPDDTTTPQERQDAVDATTLGKIGRWLYGE